MIMLSNILGHNEFTGPIPSELGHLKNLVSLNYGANALTGTIPTELSSLPNLLFMFYGKYIFRVQINTLKGF